MTLLTPDFLETKVYPAIADRLVLASMLREGVVGATDFAASQRATANMSVDVAQGEAWVQGDDTSYQGLYHIRNDAVLNVASQLSGGAWVDNSTGTFPRIDTVVLSVNDSTDGARTSDGAVIGAILGTPTSGATLGNMLGAPSIPNTAMPICNVLVPAGGTSVTAANIQNRRARAFGYTTAVAGTGNTSALGGAFATIPGMSTTIITSPGQFIDCVGQAYMGGSSSGTGAMFAHWTMIEGAGTTTYGLDSPVHGSVAGTGNMLVPVVTRFVPTIYGFTTIRMEAYTSGGNNGVGIGSSGFSHGRIRVLNE